jgi:hypothetical protein
MFSSLALSPTFSPFAESSSNSLCVRHEVVHEVVHRYRQEVMQEVHTK